MCLGETATDVPGTADRAAIPLDQATAERKRREPKELE